MTGFVQQYDEDVLCLLEETLVIIYHAVYSYLHDFNGLQRNIVEEFEWCDNVILFTHIL